MDYGSSTKRYGDYILDDKNVKNPFEAENKVKELFMNGSDPDLNPYFNFTRGKILSKTIMIDQLELLKVDANLINANLKTSLIKSRINHL